MSTPQEHPVPHDEIPPTPRSARADEAPITVHGRSPLERLITVEEQTAELDRQMIRAIGDRDAQHTETSKALASLKLDVDVILGRVTAAGDAVSECMAKMHERDAYVGDALFALAGRTTHLEGVALRLEGSTARTEAIAARLELRQGEAEKREDLQNLRLAVEFAKLHRQDSSHDMAAEAAQAKLLILEQKLTVGEQLQRAAMVGIYQGGKLLVPTAISALVFAILSHLHLIGAH